MNKILIGLMLVSSLAFSEIEVCPFSININGIKHYKTALINLKKYDIREAEIHLTLAKSELEETAEAFKCSNKYLLHEIDLHLNKMR